MQAVQGDAGLAEDGHVHEEEHKLARELLRGVCHGDAALPDARAALHAVVGRSVEIQRSLEVLLEEVDPGLVETDVAHGGKDCAVGEAGRIPERQGRVSSPDTWGCCWTERECVYERAHHCRSV